MPAFVRRFYGFAVIAALASGTAACSAETGTSAPLTTVTLQLLWSHNAEFAGFYAADLNGYFAEEGLAVTFLEGGPTVDYLGPVADGKAQFGVAGADELILARASGRPFQAIATIYRRSPVVFVALASSEISRPEDFTGKTVRVTPQILAPFRAMMARAGVPPDSYTEVVLPSDVDLFASGQADIWSAYVNNLAVILEDAGYELNYIYPDDYGVHFYGDSLYTTDDLINGDPDLVLRFLRASLRGWTWAVENPAEVGDLVVRYGPGADPELESRKMTASLLLVNTGEDHIGWMEREVWLEMEQTLRGQFVLNQPVDIEQVFTTDFLELVYP